VNIIEDSTFDGGYSQPGKSHRKYNLLFEEMKRKLLDIEHYLYIHGDCEYLRVA
jgi:hypothetical protein